MAPVEWPSKTTLQLYSIVGGEWAGFDPYSSVEQELKG